jgi:AAA domain/Bifunctional DNA primase/polymerase, N-terminal
MIEPIVCPACGHRNADGAETCWRCKANLKEPAGRPPLVSVVQELDPAVAGALEMAALGYPQIAVWGILQTGATEAEAVCMCAKGAGCTSPGKHPIVVGWQEMATTTPAVIRAWAKRNPGCNFGTPGGDGLWFVEFDGYQANGHRLKDLRGFGIPLEAYSVSGKGVHVMGAGKAKNGQVLYQGATARSEGYFCVSPGSRHYTGRRYGRRKHLLPRVELPRFDIPEPEGPPAPPERAESTGLIPPGRRHEALKILASTLHNKGVSKPAGIEALKAYRDEDFDDTGREVTDEEIEKIAEWMWKDEARNPITPAADSKNPNELVATDTIEVRPQEWLEKYWMPVGELGILAGWGDCGKSTLLIRKAGELGRGEMIGGQTKGWSQIPPAATLYISAEDNPETTIGARARAAGVAPGTLYVRKLEPGAIGIRIPDHIDWLRREIRRTGARLVVFDPILAFVPTIYDSHKDQDTRFVLAPLADLAQEERVTIFFVMHVNKGSASAQLVSRISGNNAWSNACRVVWAVKKEIDSIRPEERTYVLHMPKHNLAVDQMPKRYRLESCEFRTEKGEWIETSRVVFLGDAEDADLSNFFEPTDTSDRTLTEEVIEAYHDILRDGPKPQTEVMNTLKGEMGVTAGKGTIYNAKKKAGIKSAKGADGTWRWAFAGHGHPTQLLCPICDRTSMTSNESG